MTLGPHLVVGCGYLGRRVADAWQAAGAPVHAVTRSAARADEFRAAGLLPVVADVTHPETLEALASLPPLDTVLYAVGFDRKAGPSMREVYVAGLQRVLERLPETRRLIYISSTGVYGDQDGDWVDEDSPCRPDRENGKICLEAEALLRGSDRYRSRTTILRLAGIYGPGRIPNREALLAGRPLNVPLGGYLNLIHVDDGVRVVQEAERAEAGKLYVVSDGAPVPREEYYRELARLLNAPEPSFAPPAVDDPAALRSSASKRIRSDRMRAELKPVLVYPSYREGLAAIVSG